MSKFDLNFHNPHGPWWEWRDGQMVFECKCGDPIPCDQMKVSRGWLRHVQMIAESMSNGNYSSLVGKEVEEVVDVLWDLVEIERERQ